MAARIGGEWKVSEMRSFQGGVVSGRPGSHYWILKLFIVGS